MVTPCKFPIGRCEVSSRRRCGSDRISRAALDANGEAFAPCDRRPSPMLGQAGGGLAHDRAPLAMRHPALWLGPSPRNTQRVRATSTRLFIVSELARVYSVCLFVCSEIARPLQPICLLPSWSTRGEHGQARGHGSCESVIALSDSGGDAVDLSVPIGRKDLMTRSYRAAVGDPQTLGQTKVFVAMPDTTLAPAIEHIAHP